MKFFKMMLKYLHPNTNPIDSKLDNHDVCRHQEFNLPLGYSIEIKYCNEMWFHSNTFEILLSFLKIGKIFFCYLAKIQRLLR